MYKDIDQNPKDISELIYLDADDALREELLNFIPNNLIHILTGKYWIGEDVFSKNFDTSQLTIINQYELGKLIERFSTKLNKKFIHVLQPVNTDPFCDDIKAHRIAENIYKKAMLGKNNVAIRHSMQKAHEITLLDSQVPEDTKPIYSKRAIYCYGCVKRIKYTHPVYIYSCIQCGDLFQTNRRLSRDLSNQTALVTGARTKLGFQISLKLLRAGANVIGTSRNIERALYNYSLEPDCDQWIKRLHLQQINFNPNNIEQETEKLVEVVKSKYKCINILINNAAQTIRFREKFNYNQNDIGKYLEQNRYGDLKHVPNDVLNSWALPIDKVEADEMDELFHINAIAPTRLFIKMLPFLQSSPIDSYVVNVHAREGLFETTKTPHHIHTNMAKAALHMLTNCIASNPYPKVHIHGCDPGWFSQDEYSIDQKPWIIPPIDEVDAAARILYPVWKEMSSRKKTRRHFVQMSN